jgi:branched-chain amino acid transport system permease protein
MGGGSSSVLLLLLPLVLSGYHTYVFTSGLVLSIAILGLFFIAGPLGEVSLAQGTFMGVGAFGAVRLQEDAGFGFLGTVVLMPVVTALLVGIIVIPTLRARAALLTISTLAMAVAADTMLFSSDRIFGKNPGSVQVQDPQIVGRPISGDTEQYYLILVFFALALLVAVVTDRGRLGRSMRAIGNGDVVAASRGVDVLYIRGVTFALSSAYASLAGVLFAYQQGAVSAISFDFLHGALFALCALLASRSIYLVPVVATLYAVSPEVFREIPALSSTNTPLLFAIAVVLVLRWRATSGRPGARRSFWSRRSGGALGRLAGAGRRTGNARA